MLAYCCTLLQNASLDEKGILVVTTRSYELVDQAVEQAEREIQQNYGVEQEGMALETMPLGDENTSMGFSTDVGDVSWNAPTMGCGMPTMPLGVSVHTWAATACHGMSIGLKGALQAARVLTWTGFDIMTDVELRKNARAEFERRVSGQPYISPLSPEMKHPLELPEWVSNVL